MIVAGILLLCVGAADIARLYAPPTRRWIPPAAVAVAIVAIGAVTDALVAALLALAVAAAWMWLMPAGSAPRAGLWPVAAIVALCGGFLVVAPRERAGSFGTWRLPTPVGEVSIDQLVLAVGAVVFLIESANVIVRAALDASHVGGARISVGAAVRAPGEPETTDEAAEMPVPFATEPSLRGGRVIGPVERLLVFALTLSSALTLLAAVLAAKGIVRFPEISRDDQGGRAEYFLIGSLVSWLVALAAAFAVWWAFTRS